MISEGDGSRVQFHGDLASELNDEGTLPSGKIFDVRPSGIAFLYFGSRYSRGRLDEIKCENG
jgi:hypothetical protein